MRTSLFVPALHGATIAPAETLFIPELDGQTFATLEKLAEHYDAYYAEQDARDAYDADAAYERHLETNDQYRWEHEQDEMRAAAFGGYGYGTGGSECYA